MRRLRFENDLTNNSEIFQRKQYDYENFSVIIIQVNYIILAIFQWKLGERNLIFFFFEFGTWHYNTNFFLFVYLFHECILFDEFNIEPNALIQSVILTSNKVTPFQQISLISPYKFERISSAYNLCKNNILLCQNNPPEIVLFGRECIEINKHRANDRSKID